MADQAVLRGALSHVRDALEENQNTSERALSASREALVQLHHYLAVSVDFEARERELEGTISRLGSDLHSAQHALEIRDARIAELQELLEKERGEKERYSRDSQSAWTAAQRAEENLARAAEEITMLRSELMRANELASQTEKRVVHLISRIRNLLVIAEPMSIVANGSGSTATTTSRSGILFASNNGNNNQFADSINTPQKRSGLIAKLMMDLESIHEELRKSNNNNHHHRSQHSYSGDSLLNSSFTDQVRHILFPLTTQLSATASVASGANSSSGSIMSKSQRGSPPSILKVSSSSTSPTVISPTIAPEQPIRKKGKRRPASATGDSAVSQQTTHSPKTCPAVVEKKPQQPSVSLPLKQLISNTIAASSASSSSFFRANESDAQDRAKRALLQILRGEAAAAAAAGGTAATKQTTPRETSPVEPTVVLCDHTDEPSYLV